MNEKVSCAIRLREALSLRDMTQAELCKLTGIKKSAMSQYCNGILIPRQDRTFLLARALNVSEPWLMGFDVPIDREKSTPDAEDGLDVEFIELFMQLNESERSLVIAQIKGILASR